MTRTEFIYYLMLNGVPKEKAEEVAKYFDFERPKGEWELVGTGFVVCSCCNRAIGQAPIGKPNFCPNCGADMRGEE